MCVRCRKLSCSQKITSVHRLNPNSFASHNETKIEDIIHYLIHQSKGEAILVIYTKHMLGKYRLRKRSRLLIFRSLELTAVV